MLQPGASVVDSVALYVLPTDGVAEQAAAQVARALGLFGSPTFAVGPEIFWGHDRMEDALLWAVAHPGTG